MKRSQVTDYGKTERDRETERERERRFASVGKYKERERERAGKKKSIEREKQEMTRRLKMDRNVKKLSREWMHCNRCWLESTKRLRWRKQEREWNEERRRKEIELSNSRINVLEQILLR